MKQFDLEGCLALLLIIACIVGIALLILSPIN